MDKLLIINNKLVKIGNKIVCRKDTVDPYNPLNLPANTVRVRTNDGNVPKKVSLTSYETATLVPGTSDVYDVYKSGTSFERLFRSSNNVIEVLGANTSNVTNMQSMFEGCTALQSVPLFDTSNVMDMSYMFTECTHLTTIPLFDTSKVINMGITFYKCYNVQSGALALYQQASSQANPPTKHNRTFGSCGSNTETGAAELAQIPDDWK